MALVCASHTPRWFAGRVRAAHNQSEAPILRRQHSQTLHVESDKTQPARFQKLPTQHTEQICSRTRPSIPKRFRCRLGQCVPHFGVEDRQPLVPPQVPRWRSNVWPSLGPTSGHTVRLGGRRTTSVYPGWRATTRPSSGQIEDCRIDLKTASTSTPLWPPAPLHYLHLLSATTNSPPQPPATISYDSNLPFTTSTSPLLWPPPVLLPSTTPSSLHLYSLWLLSITPSSSFLCFGLL